ncbi:MULTISPECIES: helix-turn-helix domain-containing protein [unclassified Streptomyces]|uniref:helix-turn-helix domain-containing protein n=1 Tax=unclassified Streptomyces TaxID=2593676 RepID=UPI0036C203E6
MHHVRQFLYQSGGIRLTPQRRSERHLTGSEREEISRGIAAGDSARQLAKRLGRSPSTVPPRDRPQRRPEPLPSCVR